jgi:protein-S-isoprenylcysteine O-methyltransferase Ste14
MTEDLKNLAAELQRRGIPPRYFKAQLRRGRSPEEIFAAWPRPSHLDRVGSRRSRRLLVAGVYGGWLLVALLSKLFSSPDSLLPVIPFVLIANGFATIVLANGRTYLSREVLAGDIGLDERLIQNRNHAFRIAFQIFAPVALIAWLLTLGNFLLLPARLTSSDALLMYLGVALLATTLPTAIWAWREPDPAEPEPPTT